MTRRRTSLTVEFTIGEQAPVGNGRTYLLPDYARVEMVVGERVSVFVKGHVIRKDRQISARRAQMIYGRFGIPLGEAPDWVAWAVHEVLRMLEAADAKA